MTICNRGMSALKRGPDAMAMRAWRDDADKGNALAQRNVGDLHWSSPHRPDDGGHGVFVGRRRAHRGKACGWAEVAYTKGVMDASLLRDDAFYKISRRPIERAKEVGKRCIHLRYKDCPAR